MTAYITLLHKSSDCGRPRLTLTTDHPQASYGVPVAYFEVSPDMVYGTGDIQKMFGSCTMAATPGQLILAADEQDCAPKEVQKIIDAWNQQAQQIEDADFSAWMAGR